jgi:anhydro-N-acetylmuramic acid kinase
MRDAKRYKVVGLMSGTSLDGLDIGFCIFNKAKTGWDYSIETAQTIRYNATWLKNLSTAHNISGEELMHLDAAYGKFLGGAVQKFISANRLKPDFISSHGHTIYHQPDKGFTYQLGNGNIIHAIASLPVIYNFRALDVALGGEGAPLVPAGDKFLFSEYDVCLNLGGIANLSCDVKKRRLAYDVAFCNMGLNYLMSGIGKEYDEGGELSSEGEVNEKLLNRLNKVNAKLRKKRPSLGREMFENLIQPLADDKSISLQDKLRTFTESSAAEIAFAILELKKNAKVLCTGGGAFNSFLISRILDHCGDNATLIIPDEQIVKFKEAMVFAFLGVLKTRGEVNCLKSVTGASRDSSGGVMVGF